MKRYMKLLFGIAALMLAAAIPAQAQLVFSNTQTINLSLAAAESYSITATPGSITLNPVSGTPGAYTASGPISVTTNFNLATSRTELALGAWLGSVNAALAGPGGNIPSSDFTATFAGVQPSSSACTITGGNFAGEVFGAMCGGWQPAGSPMTFWSGTQTETVMLSLAGVPTTLTPGAYTGTITFEAEVD